MVSYDGTGSVHLSPKLYQVAWASHSIVTPDSSNCTTNQSTFLHFMSRLPPVSASSGSGLAVGSSSAYLPVSSSAGLFTLRIPSMHTHTPKLPPQPTTATTANDSNIHTPSRDNTFPIAASHSTSPTDYHELMRTRHQLPADATTTQSEGARLPTRTWRETTKVPGDITPPGLPEVEACL